MLRCEVSETITDAELILFFGGRVAIGKTTEGVVSLARQVIDPQLGIELPVVVTESSIEQGIATGLAEDVGIISRVITVASINGLDVAA